MTTSSNFSVALTFAVLGLLGSMAAFRMGYTYLSTPIALSCYGVALLMGLVERGTE